MAFNRVMRATCMMPSGSSSRWPPSYHLTTTGTSGGSGAASGIVASEDTPPAAPACRTMSSSAWTCSNAAIQRSKADVKRGVRRTFALSSSLTTGQECGCRRRRRVEDGGTEGGRSQSNRRFRGEPTERWRDVTLKMAETKKTQWRGKIADKMTGMELPHQWPPLPPPPPPAATLASSRFGVFAIFAGSWRVPDGESDRGTATTMTNTKQDHTSSHVALSSTSSDRALDQSHTPRQRLHHRSHVTGHMSQVTGHTMAYAMPTITCC